MPNIDIPIYDNRSRVAKGSKRAFDVVTFKASDGYTKRKMHVDFEFSGGDHLIIKTKTEDLELIIRGRHLVLFDDDDGNTVLDNRQIAYDVHWYKQEKRRNNVTINWRERATDGFRTLLDERGGDEAVQVDLAYVPRIGEAVMHVTNDRFLKYVVAGRKFQVIHHSDNVHSIAVATFSVRWHVNEKLPDDYTHGE